MASDGHKQAPQFGVAVMVQWKKRGFYFWVVFDALACSGNT
jgi:hypothetical protein